jgi:hypothetical protein
VVVVVVVVVVAAVAVAAAVVSENTPSSRPVLPIMLVNFKQRKRKTKYNSLDPCRPTHYAIKYML